MSGLLDARRIACGEEGGAEPMPAARKGNVGYETLTYHRRVST